ncbi:MAG: DUF1844 domain-containing protein [Candidatus Binatia bacterium]
MTDPEDRGFQVRDRRRFDESGEVRPESDAKVESPAAEPPPKAGAETSSRVDREDLPPITFSAFLMSLSSQALMCMGELEQEGHEGHSHVDLAAARELIDILGMLQEKTRGNLDPTESGLLDGLLYDLRMRYVGKVRG